MSTLQHTARPAIKTRLAFIVLAFATIAAVTAVLIATRAGDVTRAAVPPTQSQLQQQLESVSGARFGLQRPAAPATAAASPQQQLQRVAGPRYDLKVAAYGQR